MYWTPAQMLTHHASNGCNLKPGDLFASGTVSGPDRGSQGCLLELTRRGADAIVLPTGEERKFLHDGDEIIMRAYFQREGAARIGLGECVGLIVASSKQ
jgi:fumarylacetoacetase